MMTDRLAVFAAILMSCAVTGGCTRTSDGSLELQQPSMPSFKPTLWPFAAREEAEPEPAPVVATRFPARPVHPVTAEPVRQKPVKKKIRRKARAQAPAATTANEARRALACAKPADVGGRIKVLCQ